MELRGGRGGQLEVEDAPYIVMGKIQPLSTSSARDTRYYRSRGAVLPRGRAVLPWWTTVLPRQQQRPGLGCSTTARAVLPLPLAVLPQGREVIACEERG